MSREYEDYMASDPNQLMPDDFDPGRPHVLRDRALGAWFDLKANLRGMWLARTSLRVPDSVEEIS